MLLQAALMYSEGIIIAQYAFLVPTRLGCSFISPELVHRWGVPLKLYHAVHAVYICQYAGEPVPS